MKQVEIKILRTADADTGVPLPRYETAGAAGADIRANFADGKDVTLKPGARMLVPTGLQMEIPEGYEVQVRPRSGLALKHGVAVLNSPGTIDCDYRGPVSVILLNTGDAPFVVEHGARVAQLVVAPVTQGRFAETDSLSDSARGAGGFGSTGQG